MRVPYPSLEAMLEPAELEHITGRPVNAVAVEPVAGAETSTEASFLSISLNGEPKPTLHVKRVDPAIDWVALFTQDHDRRAVTMWTHGVFARMPEEVDPAVFACASWDDGYAVLMPDISAELPPRWVGMTRRQSDAALDAMAAMHGTFWEDEGLADPDLGLCAPELFLSHTSPKKAAAMKRRLSALVFDAIEEGWDLLPSYMDRGLVDELRELNDDPTPMLAALDSAPMTLVHSDIRPANMGIRPHTQDGAEVMLIDWGRPVGSAIRGLWSRCVG